MSLTVITTITALVLVALFFASRAAYYLTLSQAEEQKRRDELDAFERDRLAAAQRLADSHANHADDLRQLRSMIEGWLEEPHALIADPLDALCLLRRSADAKILLLANTPRHY